MATKARDLALAASNVDTFGNVDAATVDSIDSAQFLRSDIGNASIDLAPIEATIADTAVDVFVYDTRKDSDGGAWRKRTQGTSWYNETLNTDTRGSRKEFPAVAVIVVQESQTGTLTIYDGDDPDMPMWMVFNGKSDSSVPMLRTGISSVTMMNGQLAIGHDGGSNNNRLTHINLITEDATVYYANGNPQHWDYDILARNRSSGGNGYSVGQSAGDIVNRYVNDVAMTVLPNAPIDAATGLPVPTIAVATDGGVSVIKDDGTVVDITIDQGTGYSKAVDVIFTSRDQIRAAHESGVRMIKSYNIPSADASFDNWAISDDDGTTLWYTDIAGSSSYGDLRFLNASGAAKLSENSVGTSLGLTLLNEDTTTPANGMVSYITSDYNTGWMNGDIKLATLSDTDDTNVTGGSLLTGQKSTYDVDTSTSGWNTQPSATVSHSSGNGNGGGNAIAVTSSGGSNIYASLDTGLSLTSGKQYILQFDIRNSSGIAASVVNASQNAYNSGTQYGNILNSTDNLSTTYRTVYFTFTALTANLNLNVYAGIGNNVAVYLDNIQVHEAEEDRSVNGNGLQVFGTVTKTPVATGADLVAYSGFSGSNYLEQPYNSDLDFGTGDFCYMMWADVQGTTEYFFTTEDGSSSGNAVRFSHETPYTRVTIKTHSGDSLVLLNGSEATGLHHFAIVRRNGILNLYIDGKLDASVANTSSIENSKLRIGEGVNNSYPNAGSLTLFRISATAPSPEQIKKIYEDEKVLFQENAQATLYGSSGAVTALAYDDSTELLHVGTSAGRSVFQGLRRVDNTTTAVGAAISASNGLVADE